MKQIALRPMVRKPAVLMALSAVTIMAASTFSAEAAKRKAADSAPAAVEDGMDAQAAQRQRIEQQRMSWATFRHRQFAEGVVGNYWDNGYAWNPAAWRAKGVDVGMGGIGVESDNYIYDPSFAGAYPDSRRMPQRGRSAVSGHAASGSFGQYCTTPVKSCQLQSPSDLGGGCSCKVAGGRSRGQVTP